MDKNNQELLLTLSTKFKTLVAPFKLFFFIIAEILHDVFHH